jgi:hypothetical protein
MCTSHNDNRETLAYALITAFAAHDCPVPGLRYHSAEVGFVSYGDHYCVPVKLAINHQRAGRLGIANHREYRIGNIPAEFVLVFEYDTTEGGGWYLRRIEAKGPPAHEEQAAPSQVDAYTWEAAIAA